MTIKRQFLAAVAVTLSAFTFALPAKAIPIDNIVFFGDSLSDTGNIWYATGGFPLPPYNQGSSGGAPDFTGGQWSDPLGPSWPTVFASMFGLTATPSVVGGNNYAWGGARTGVNPDPFGAPWLDQQVGLYATTGTPPSGRTLASVMIGGNDVANNLTNPSATTDGINSIITQLGILRDLGVSDIIVANVPDVGATPRFQELDAAAPGTAGLATASTLAWNTALMAALSDFDSMGTNVGLLDLFGLGQDPMLLSSYTNLTDPCFTGSSVCANPAEYFYWDSFHPSSTAHAQIARAAFLVTVPVPGSLALLCLGFTTLLLGARRKRL